MKTCGYIIAAIIAIALIVMVVMFAGRGITGKVVLSPCSDIGINGIDVLPEYRIEFEALGYKCFESPAVEEAYCCIK